ncbi:MULTISPECIES: MoaD/ThiS family protein [unclassified Methanoculleus]|jgi:sulfur carrier protein ThiS|uniref:Thiamine S protein n=1 Tax=Methanoculleus palmolei TaxID=72612 RepID=A0ABD8A6K2_9EURY|nr:MoaD/ThiS family protein [Methanoculleus sp. UBA377]MDD2473011.1 thiamine S protein [Methanoculleus sp.]WOX55102.1 thiamine S protein [Methanoculleus palmolei]
MRIILPNKSARTVSRPPIPIEELLLELGINPTTVIVVKNGRVVPEDVTAGEDDEIQVIQFSHGG